jgi:hypothetical protein
MAGRVVILPLLSKAETRRHANTVLALRRYWIARPRAPSHFHSLGVNAYMDLAGGAAGRSRYASRVQSSNDCLRAHFAPLLEAVSAAIAEHMGEPTTLHHPFALPGMHIWEGRAIPRARGASLHFDLQHQLLKWPPELKPERSATLSFTVALRLPADGGSLWTWDYSYADYRAARRSGRPHRLRDVAAATPTEHVYELGSLVLHSGHVLHQIAPVARRHPGDVRITLQGHGIRAGGAWLLYW